MPIMMSGYSVIFPGLMIRFQSSCNCSIQYLECMCVDFNIQNLYYFLLFVSTCTSQSVHTHHGHPLLDGGELVARGSRHS